MKTFRLYLGGSGQVGTFEITLNPTYEIVVQIIQQLRTRLLSNEVLREPILHLFKSVYEDDSEFPQHLKSHTPIEDQISNKTKIQAIRTHPPSDGDVVDFLTDAFPHLYLELSSFCEGDLLWGETVSGRESADNEEVTINIQLIQQWLKAVKEDTQIAGVKLSLMVVAVFLHELVHSSLIWYGRGSCDSPKLGHIDGEAGEYYERAIFGGISTCEIDNVTLQIRKVGFHMGSSFFPIDRRQADEILKLDTSKGLPLTNRITLSAAPPPTHNRFRTKIFLSRFKFAFFDKEPESMIEKSATHFYTSLKGDKRRVMPQV